jgi:hypothetical protein
MQNNIIKRAKFAVVTVALLFAGHAHAFFSPLSVGIIPPVQFPPDEFSITGVRISAIYGNHRDLYGIDIGVLGNITQQDFVGIGISGLANITHGNTTIIGLQLAGAVNYNSQKTNVYGVQVALGMNDNTAESSVTGLQLALVNLSPNTTINGFQLGIYNRALTVNGFQIGLVNATNSLRGLQIGLINFNHTGFFEVSPILNVGF